MPIVQPVKFPLALPFGPSEPAKSPPRDDIIEEWEKKAQGYINATRKSDERLKVLTAEYNKLQRPPDWVPEWLRWIPNAGYAAWGPYSSQGLTANLKPQLQEAQAEIERNDFYARLYAQVPFTLSTGRLVNSEEVMSLLTLPPNMPAGEVDEVQEIIEGMIDVFTGVPPQPEMALEAEPIDLPVLEPPTNVATGPIELHRLTVEQVVKALSAPVIPDSVLPGDEWAQFLIDSGQISNKVDLESIQYMENQAEAIIAEWQERGNMLTSFREGVAEMPDYELVDMMKDMVIQPGIMALSTAQFYFEHVSMPLAGAVYKTFIPDIEVEYQRLRRTESTWQALAHAWEEWDAPGEGAAEWILKYMLMEGLVDPLTYVGWGIATKITKPLGAFGRMVGAMERGAAATLELPFDLLKYGIRKLPKTLGQHATIASHKAGQFTEKYMTTRFGKALWQMEMSDWVEGSKAAITSALRNPGAQTDMARAGRELLKHTPVTEREVVEWANRLGTTLRPEDITRNTVDSVDSVVEMFIAKSGSRKKLLTLPEASDELVRILYGSLDPDKRVIASKILSAKRQNIISGARSFNMARSPLEAIRNLMKRNYKIHVDTQNSMAALARKQMGSVATMLDDIPIRVQKVWARGLDKWVVRPFAESYLTFGMYGPMNIIEDVIRTVLGGVTPGMKDAKAFARLSTGLSVDPNLHLAGDAISETMGMIRKRVPGESNNWVLQLAFIGSKTWSERAFHYLTRVPGQVSLAMRRNFVARRYMQILKEMGGETVERLARTGPDKLLGITDKKLIKDIQQTAMMLKLQGDPNIVRAAKADFTRAKILRKEVDRILTEHPDLPRATRDFIMHQYDDGGLFREGGTTITRTIGEANTRMVDDFVRSAEYAHEGFEQLAQTLVELEVRNPQEMAQLIQSLNLMSSMYGATPKQIMGRAVEQSRRLPMADRRLSIDKAMDSITIFREKAGVSMDKLIEKIKADMPKIHPDDPAYVTQATQLFDLQIAKRVRASELGEEINAWRHEWFAEGRPEDLLRETWWDNYYLEVSQRWHEYNLDMARFDGQIKNAIDGLDIVGGIKPRQRPAIRVTDRELAPNDVAQMLGARGDDVSRGLLDVMTAQNDKDMFVEYVMAHVKDGDVGFSHQSVGKVFDQISGSLHISPENMNWLAGKRLELKAVGDDLHSLHNGKLLPENEIASIGKYFDDTAKALEDEMFVPVEGGVVLEGPAPQMFSYVGGKGQLTPQIIPEIGYVSGNLIDPFFGSGAVPFGARKAGIVKGNVIGYEANSDIVNIYKVAKAQPDELFNHVKRLYSDAGGKLDKDAVNSIIDRFNSGIGTDLDRAAQWIVIARRSGWNEVHYTKDLKIIHSARIAKGTGGLTDAFTRQFETSLREGISSARTVNVSNATSTTHLDAIRSAKKGDVVYLDPPYIGRYNVYPGEREVGVWTETMLDNMLVVAKDASSRGVRVVISESLRMRGKLSGIGAKITTVKSPRGAAVTELVGSLGPEPKLAEGLMRKPPALRPEYQGYNDIRQSAMDEAHKWYYKEFTDYNNANAFDAVMKAIYPFWTYESQRWFWLPRSFVRHPGTFTAFERWQDNTDYGYIHVPGTSVDINPFRGTVYGTLATRLSKRDFPEYYDSLGAAGDILEFNDFLTRFGFYPGAHIGIPVSLFLGQEMQLGETLPSVFKTPLSSMMAMFPDSESVRWISDHVFADRFRDYMTILTTTKLGGDGSLIFAKMKENKPLTPEEEAIWADARREVGWYSAGFEQFGLFRFRTDEQTKMYEESGKVVEEITGYTLDQQKWLRQHGYRIWDMVGGMSPSEQAVLQELDYYNWVGNVRPLLPGAEQEVLNRVELGWDSVERYSDMSLDKKLSLQRDFLRGSRGPDDYNGALLDTYDSQRQYILAQMEEQLTIPLPSGLTEKEREDFIEAHSLMTLEGRKEYYKNTGKPQPVLHPMRELLNLYYSIELEEITEPETGEKVRDWDTFWALRQSLEDAIPDEYKQEWDDFLSRNSTRMEEVRRDVYATYFSPYNKIWDKILSTYPENEQALITEYLSLERRGINLARQQAIKDSVSAKTSRKLISSFRSETSDAKKALRYYNPNLDAWLFYWGRTTSFASPTGEDVYRRISAETGRRIQ